MFLAKTIPITEATIPAATSANVKIAPSPPLYTIAPKVSAEIIAPT